MKIVSVKKLIHYLKVKDWCALPYPGHPKGCPNYGKKEKCPPQSPYVTDIFDLTKKLYFVYSEFDLAAHMEEMKQRHPHWTERQLRNVLYWQNTSKKEARGLAQKAMRSLKADVYTLMGESLGVHLYATCRLSGLKLEKIKGLKVCHHVALIGWKRR